MGNSYTTIYRFRKNIKDDEKWGRDNTYDVAVKRIITDTRRSTYKGYNTSVTNFSCKLNKSNCDEIKNKIINKLNSDGFDIKYNEINGKKKFMVSWDDKKLNN